MHVISKGLIGFSLLTIGYGVGRWISDRAWKRVLEKDLDEVIAKRIRKEFKVL